MSAPTTLEEAMLMLHRPQFGNARYCYQIKLTADADMRYEYSPEDRSATGGDVRWTRKAILMQAPISGYRRDTTAGMQWKLLGTFKLDDDGDVVGFFPHMHAEWDDVLRVLDSLEFPRDTATPYNFKPSPERCPFQWEVRPLGHEWYRNKCNLPLKHPTMLHTAKSGDEFHLENKENVELIKLVEDIPS